MYPPYTPDFLALAARSGELLTRKMPFGSTCACKAAPRRVLRVGARFFRIDAFRATREAQISSSKVSVQTAYIRDERGVGHRGPTLVRRLRSGDVS